MTREDYDRAVLAFRQFDPGPGQAEMCVTDERVEDPRGPYLYGLLRLLCREADYLAMIVRCGALQLAAGASFHSTVHDDGLVTVSLAVSAPLDDVPATHDAHA